MEPKPIGRSSRKNSQGEGLTLPEKKSQKLLKYSNLKYKLKTKEKKSYISPKWRKNIIIRVNKL